MFGTSVREDAASTSKIQFYSQSLYGIFTISFAGLQKDSLPSHWSDFVVSSFCCFVNPTPDWPRSHSDDWLFETPALGLAPLLAKQARQYSQKYAWNYVKNNNSELNLNTLILSPALNLRPL